jgi:hypothetical protein
MYLEQTVRKSANSIISSQLPPSPEGQAAIGSPPVPPAVVIGSKPPPHSGQTTDLSNFLCGLCAGLLGRSGRSFFKKVIILAFTSNFASPPDWKENPNLIGAVRNFFSYPDLELLLNISRKTEYGTGNKIFLAIIRFCKKVPVFSTEWWEESVPVR